MKQAAPPSGLWRRLAIEYPDGSGDIATQAYWLQAGRFYADIRIPAGRPTITALRSFADLSQDTLSALAAQQGFAGETEMLGDRCCWQHRLDYQPPASGADAGRLMFNGRMLVEYGLHSPYIEHWWHQEAAERSHAAFRLQGERYGLLLIAGNHFMRAVDRAAPLRQEGSLASLVERAAGDETGLSGLLQCEISFGRCDGASEQWCVTHSTLPWLKHKPLFSEGNPLWEKQAGTLIEPLSGGEARVWLLADSEGQVMDLFQREKRNG